MISRMDDDATGSGSAEAGRLPRDYPPFLYIPCVSHVTDGAHAEAVYRQTKDGRSALLVYSSLDRLLACQGADQPWFGLPLQSLQMLHDVRRFDIVYTDVYVPEERRAPEARVGL